MLSFLIAGSGGREAAFAESLSRGARLHAVMAHENPQIADCVRRSGGRYAVGDADDPDTVLGFARQLSPDYAFVNADQPLANGVIDALLGAGIRAVGATRAASRIEWDKAYSMEVMSEACPEYTPFHRTVSDERELKEAMSEFESRGLQVVVKPQGLTGGKGVKVMPEHLPAYADCSEYASSVLRDRGEKAVLVERLDGPEFTVMGLTDGRHLVLSPASYDYPFRCEGDSGAGTGGMGCFTSGARLPFMDGRDEADCAAIMRRVLDKLRGDGARFSGVLNGGFFKTARGIRFMEFNARFGDPECLNVLSVLKTPLDEAVMRMWDGTLSARAVGFSGESSVSKYLVAREYPDPSPEPVRFKLDAGAAEAGGARVFFASCVREPDGGYRTLRKSRVAAFCATSETVEDASSAVDSAIEEHFEGDLEYRRDIGSAQNLRKLAAAGHVG